MAWFILIILIGVPLVELFILIKIGATIGGFGVILLSLATAALGITLVREQGLKVVRDIQKSSSQQAGGHIAPDTSVIGTSLIHGFFLLCAGIMLMFPGFVTDAIGGFLLIPPIRILLGKLGLATLVAGQIKTHSPKNTRTSTVIEGEIITSDEEIRSQTHGEGNTKQE